MDDDRTLEERIGGVSKPAETEETKDESIPDQHIPEELLTDDLPVQTEEGPSLINEREGATRLGHSIGAPEPHT